jgi:hypothetical protein
MNRTVTAVPLRLAFAAVLTLMTGCNNTTRGTESPPVPTPSPTQYTLITQGEFVDLPSSQGSKANAVSATKAIPFVFTPPVSFTGSLQAQVNWTSPTDSLAVAFYPGGCTSEQLGVGSCAPLAEGTSSGATGETVFLNTPAAGKYVLGIVNLGPAPESGAYQVTLAQ